MKGKIIFRIVKYGLITLLSLPFIYILIAFVLSYIPSSLETEKDPKNEYIFISSNGVHLDIIFPNRLLTENLRTELNTPSTSFTSFGWGDKDFYLNTPEWKDLSFKTAYSALFCTSETLMHVDRYTKANPRWDSVAVSQNNLNALQEHITGSFYKDSTDAFVKIPNAHYSNLDNFYYANGSYSCFMTCNTWVNSALKQSNLPASLWTPFDFGVLYHIRN